MNNESKEVILLNVVFLKCKDDIRWVWWMASYNGGLMDAISFEQRP